MNPGLGAVPLLHHNSSDSAQSPQKSIQKSQTNFNQTYQQAKLPDQLYLQKQASLDNSTSSRLQPQPAFNQ